MRKLKQKRRGRKNQEQGSQSEKLVMKKLRKNGWICIPTSGSRSAIDILAYHRRRNLWWGIQVKSSGSSKTYDYERLSDLCNQLYMTPILAIVGRDRNGRFVGLCKVKNSKYYHMNEDGTIYHPIPSDDLTCRYFKPKIGVAF